MLRKRTDLALEVHELHGDGSGIEVEEKIINGILVTTAVISEGEGEFLSGKSAGKYITLDVGRIWRMESSRFDELANLIANELTPLIPEGDGCVLVAGLGNENITPDSLGPRVVKKLLVTRHIRSMEGELFKTAGFGCVSAVATGVLGQTGIESSEIIKSIVGNIKPKCIIAIDALASRRLNRLATTVQITDGGISPGSGVANNRKELSKKLFGVPVIPIGVPTVVDAATLAFDLLEEHLGAEDIALAEAVEKMLSSCGGDMFVTPKDNDIIAAKSAQLLANAINIALHKMPLWEIKEYVD